MLLSLVLHMYSLRSVLPAAVMLGSAPTYLLAWGAWRLLSACLPARFYQAVDDRLYCVYQSMVLFFFENYTGVQVGERAAPGPAPPSGPAAPRSPGACRGLTPAPRPFSPPLPTPAPRACGSLTPAPQLGPEHVCGLPSAAGQARGLTVGFGGEAPRSPGSRSRDPPPPPLLPSSPSLVVHREGVREAVEAGRPWEQGGRLNWALGVRGGAV